MLNEMTEMVGRARMGDLLGMLATELAQRFGADLGGRGPASDLGDCSGGGVEGGRAQLMLDAHAMVSAASMVGFVALAETCRAVEAACRAGDDVGPLLSSLQAQAGLTITEIAALRAA